MSVDYESHFKCLLIRAKGGGTLAPRERDWILGFCAATGGSDELIEELASYPATEEVRDVLNQSAATFAEFGNGRGPLSMIRSGPVTPMESWTAARGTLFSRWQPNSRSLQIWSLNLRSCTWTSRD
ncbi:MAG: hypothetical protein ACRD0K_20835 [Egibacteraceae bacterium]